MTLTNYQRNINELSARGKVSQRQKHQEKEFSNVKDHEMTAFRVAAEDITRLNEEIAEYLSKMVDNGSVNEGWNVEF